MVSKSMRWTGRQVFVMILLSMVVSSLLTFTLISSGQASPTMPVAAQANGNGLLPKEASKLNEAYQIVKGLSLIHI